MTKECLRCGNENVTDHFHRVNSNNDGELWSCVRCTPAGETLRSEDETSRSEVYERHLEEIKNGKEVPAIGKGQ